MLTKFSIITKKKLELIDITDEVKSIIEKSNVKDGIVNVSLPHTSAALITAINSDENANQDFFDTLSKLIPKGLLEYKHIGENSDSHIKSALLGTEKNIIIEERELLLGKWQSLFLCELDGPRERHIFVKILVG